MTRRPFLMAFCCLLLLPTVARKAHAASPPAYTFLEEPVSGEVDVRAQVTVGKSWGKGAFARIALCYLDEANHLFVELDGRGARLGKVQAGTRTILASHAGWPAPGGGERRLVIKRRVWSITVLCDETTLLTAYDEFSPGGKIGAVSKGVTVGDLSTQPIGEICFREDFARPPDEDNPWQTLLGNWETCLPESRNRKAQAARSANPFTFKATAPGTTALAAEGSGYWDSYEARVAVKPEAEGLVGLAFYLQDKDNYLLLRAPAAVPGKAGEAGKAAVVRVLQGKETVLAEAPCALRVGAWQELRVRVAGGAITGLVDGREVCAASDGTFGQGRIALYAKDCARALFDDVAVDPYSSFADTYAPPTVLPVTAVEGSWQAGRKGMVVRPARSGKALGLTGATAWRSYAFAADVTAGSCTAVGVCFGYLGPGEYYLFRWGASAEAPDKSFQELSRVSGGHAAVLARREAALDDAKTHRVEVLCDRAYLSVSVDGARVCEAADPGRVSGGRVGYYAEGSAKAAAGFSNARVRFVAPPAAPISITEQFAREDTMANWARPAASWRWLDSGLYSYTLPVWGDFCLRATLPAKATGAWGMSVLTAATGDGLAKAAPCVSVSAGADGPEVTCVADGKTTTAKPRVEAPLLSVERRGGCIVVSLDGAPFARAATTEGAQAPAVGLKLTGYGLSTNEITLTSPNIIDEGFASAPTRWLPVSGNWDISDRWHCSPQWSWFCGRDAVTPLLWSKRSFSGDVVFEFWGAMMMDLTSAPHYSHPSDLNGILCGDGESVGSGYGFVYAGDNNTVGRITRRGASVAQTPAFRWDNPVGANTRFHNAWFHSRMEKSAGHLRFTLDDSEPLEYDDPDPLAGGHVGVWTAQGNGILVARARVAFRR